MSKFFTRRNLLILVGGLVGLCLFCVVLAILIPAPRNSTANTTTGGNSSNQSSDSNIIATSVAGTVAAMAKSAPTLAVQATPTPNATTMPQLSNTSQPSTALPAVANTATTLPTLRPTNTPPPTSTLKPSNTAVPTKRNTATRVPTLRPTSTPRPTSTARPTVPPTQAAPSGSFGPGMKIVGTDIAPGTYRARNVSACYWERLSGFGGTLDEIIANDNTNGPTVVTIAPTDKGFRSERCGTWTKDLSPITTSPTAPFGEGTFIVNRDIAPGTWRSSGEGACYWERLSGFSGELDDIIANDNTDGQVLVTISAQDAGFSSERCGTWTKIK